MSLKYNYSNTGEIPFKLFLNEKIFQFKKKKRILPIHAVLMITNECNQNCSFCNNRDIDRSLSLKFQEVKTILEMLKRLEVDTITLSGGGEPTCHREFKEIVYLIKSMGLNVGLVTNGSNLGFSKEFWDEITWCRISLDALDDKKTNYVFKTLQQIDTRCEFTFSCIVSPSQDIEVFKNLIRKFDVYGKGFLKFIDDLYINIPNVELRNLLISMSNPNVYYNSPSFCKNNTLCYLYQLKPIFAADGYVYPCCDIQYQNSTYRGYHPSKRICHHTKYEALINEQLPIKVNCPICAHDTYNQLIRCILNPPKHENWI